MVEEEIASEDPAQRQKSNNDLEDINVFISDTEYSQLKKECKFSKGKLFVPPKEMSSQEFDCKIKLLYKCCLRGVQDLHELHLRRKMGLRVLEDLTRRAKPELFAVKHIIHIIWSLMSCIHHFQLRLKVEKTGLISWIRQKQVQRCFKIYYSLIKLIKEPCHRIALNSIITFYKEGKLWEVEFGCTEMLIGIFENQGRAEGIDDLIYTIEICTNVNIKEAKHLLQLLNNILRKLKWNSIPENLLMKFLDMVECSILPYEGDTFNYVPLRRSLENCMRNIINNLNHHDLVKIIYLIVLRLYYTEDEDSELTRSLGKMCIQAAYKYKLKSKQYPLHEGPLPITIRLFNVYNLGILRVAVKMWQHLLDRNDNHVHFQTPKIFFRECNYNLRITKCSNQDKTFFKQLKKQIYDHIINAIFLTSDRIGLENVFTAIAVALVDIPCGYTASCFVSVAMSMQEYAVHITHINRIRSHHLHATVLSILTLICYVYKADVLYDYVIGVMEKRAEWAPHLNPPLRQHYVYSQHHVLWNKPDFFFEDWEARFGLWKCFKGKRRSTVV